MFLNNKKEVAASDFFGDNDQYYGSLKYLEEKEQNSATFASLLLNIVQIQDCAHG